MTDHQAAAAPDDAPASTTRGEGEGMKREFSLWAIFALAFAFISPIVALYGIFAFAITSAGPPAWWGFFIVLAGQLLVALVFAELASRWPFEGSLYQWARRLIHETYGWFSGWAYMWTLMITMVAVSYGAAGFVPIVLDIEPFEPDEQLLVAFGFILFGSAMNLAGRTALKIFMGASIGAEVLGSIGIGTVLLFFHNEHGPGVLFDNFGAAEGLSGGYLWAGFLAATAFIGWAYVGFDTAASVAEETKEPRRDVPKAVIWSLVTVAASSSARLAGPDPRDPELRRRAQRQGGRPGCGHDRVPARRRHNEAAVRAVHHRVHREPDRDPDELLADHVGVRARRRASGGQVPEAADAGARLPWTTVGVTCVIACVLLVSTQSEDLYLTLVSMATGGFYISFAFPVLGMLWARLKGRWEPSDFSLGRWGMIVAVVASLWTVFEYINIAWPRAVDVPWYQDWAVFLMTGIVAVLGILAYLPGRSKMKAAEQRLEEDPSAIHWTEPRPEPPAAS